jgi:hypothetical protein
LAVASHRENMLDVQQALYPFENGSAILPMAFKCLSLFPIEEN